MEHKSSIPNTTLSDKQIMNSN